MEPNSPFATHDEKLMDLTLCRSCAYNPSYRSSWMAKVVQGFMSMSHVRKMSSSVAYPSTLSESRLISEDRPAGLELPRKEKYIFYCKNCVLPRSFHLKVQKQWQPNSKQTPKVPRLWSLNIFFHGKELESFEEMLFVCFFQVWGSKGMHAWKRDFNMTSVNRGNEKPCMCPELNVWSVKPVVTHAAGFTW